MTASGFEAFCGGTFWNETLLLDNTWPQFTDCFVHTALIWVPCGFLFLMMPVYVRSVNRQQNRGTSFPVTLLNGAKLFCCITLSTLALIQLLMRTDDDSVSDSVAAYLGDAFTIAAFILMAVMTQYERLRGAQSTGVPFFFWLLSLVCATVPLYTSFMEQMYSKNVVSFTVGIMIYVLLLTSLVLTIFVDGGGDSDYSPLDKQPCPETTCSYPYYLLYIWMAKMMVTGYKQDLVESDMWQLPTSEQSEELVQNFERNWASEEDRCRRINFKRQGNQATLMSVKYTANGSVADLTTTTKGSNTNGTAQLTSGSGKPMTERSSLIHQSSAEKDSEEKDKKATPSLLRVVCQLFWKDLLKYCIMKVASDCILLLNPVFLGALMSFLAEREPGRDWQGYTICLIMFLVIIAKSILFAHSMFGSSRLGMRIKSTLIAAIYQKSLTMTSAAKNKSTVGEIVNLMSVDAQRILDMMSIFFFGITTPVQLIVSIVMLYYTIGPSIFAGLGMLVILMPINLVVFLRLRTLANTNLRYKDIRIRLYNEILNGIKVLKLYAWEPSFREKIREIRLKEVGTLMKLAILNMMMSLSWDMAPFLVTLATFATYVLSNPENYLTPSKAFVALSLFNILRAPLNVLSTIIAYFVQAVVSIRRINEFLLNEDLDPSAVSRDNDNSNVISIQDGSFTWNREMPTTLTGINLQVAQGKLVAVVGPVGCGKSSLINAILGEMEKLNGSVNLKGSVAYVPQQAWIQNATMRDNILLGRSFIRSKYQTILSKCELDRDLTILAGGDMTEIGEKGINLSGGQKQRVSVARAVYSDSDVYLLDDPLSAVDSHVGKAIFKNVIGPSGILKKKTRVLVTHGVHWLPMVDEVVVITDGKISERGSYEQLMSHDGPFAQFLKNYLTTVQDEEDEEDPEIAEIRGSMVRRLDSVTSDAWSSADELGRDHEKRRRRTKRKDKKEKTSPVGLEESTMSILPLKEAEITAGTSTSGSLTTTETIETGKVGKQVFADYAKAAGVMAVTAAFLFYCVFQAFSVATNFWLNRWTEDPALLNASSHLHVTANVATNVTTNVTDDYDDVMSPSEVLENGNNFYLTIYGVMGLCQVFGLLGFNYLFWTRMVEAARVMHAKLADRIMRSPMAFFDTTPIGRILNRVSRDMETVDNTLPLIMRGWLVTFAMVLMTLVVIIIQTPLSIVVLGPILVIYYFCQSFYVPTARQLKRIESVTRSPIYTLFSETMGGASSIRAYGVTRSFLQDNRARVDRNTVYYFASMGAVRWLQLNLDVLAGIVVMAAGLFAIINNDSKSADAGLSVSYALQVSGTLTWMTRQISEFETNIVSVERLKEYSELETEAEWVIPEKRPPPSWPESGKVTFDNYMTRYRPGLDLVLKGVTCTITNGEKVGIVGRTGAGKSSLTLSLFRLIEAAGGSISIDGLNIADMGLHDLRSHLTILPQDPVLFSGSLRMNLDPFDEYDDQQLWKALERAHLRQAVNSLPGHLDFECGEEGSNLSMGQRQLVCLARTLLRKTKILVLDEATAAVDMETDALIQDTIRNAFSSSTIITIAHRLNTIMDYDRIMVMDSGLVTEFASPNELLSDKQSVFYAMAKDANLV